MALEVPRAWLQAPMATPSATGSVMRNSLAKRGAKIAPTTPTTSTAETCLLYTSSESDTFYCSGSVRIADHTIHCSKTTGHGSQTLAEAVGNSCNPAFIAIGQRLGIDLFYDYFEAFGMKEKTDIDQMCIRDSR